MAEPGRNEMPPQSQAAGDGSVSSHDISTPLLNSAVPEVDGDDDKLLCGWPKLQAMCAELREQYKLGGPLSITFFLLYLVSVITMAFLGHLGKKYLAAAAMMLALANTLGRLFFIGLCGATDTQASQAYGAGHLDALPIIFQRTVLFLAAHLAPVTAFIILSPHALRSLGQDAELCLLMGRFLWVVVPGLWLEIFDRPMNRILVNQRITEPQMWISGVVVVLHLMTNLALMRVPGYNYLYVGAADSVARFYYFGIQAGYIIYKGYGPRVWGTPNAAAWRGWGKFARLAYPAAGMRCLESFSYAGMTIIAGSLPNASVAVSAIGLAFNTYGVIFMAFIGIAVSCGTRVGNALGAVRPGHARLAALTAISFVPVIWIPIGLVLTLPWTQGLLVRVFVDVHADPVLARVLGNLLYIVAGLELLDGMQTVMGGVLTGAGKQLHGVAVNFVAFYMVAFPVAISLGFKTPLGVYGLYLGLALGPALQCVIFFLVIIRIRWKREAALASDGAAAMLVPPASRQPPELEDSAAE